MTANHPFKHTLLEKDARDPLYSFRARFLLDESLVYLDGNSLGALPKDTPVRLAQVAVREWGEGLIRSWNNAGWIDMPQRIGNKIARLIGANAGEVIVADSTSVNLFKVLAAALKLNAGRRVILSQRDNFPTDLYMAQGLIGLLGGAHELRLVDADDIAAATDENTAAVMLTHVNYRTGALHDMAGITQAVHAKGTLVIWDLAHSAGALPVSLNDANADFAIGCGYKYLNGGPGAPAFVFVARRHQPNFVQPLTGWLGHVNPFAFDATYAPADGILRALCGTPAVLSMAALEAGVDLMLEADMNSIREKSLQLADDFIALIEQRCGRHGLQSVTPREHALRGSQVCFAHPQAFSLMQALIAQGVIGDFRAPDILRFGFAPLYVRFADVWHAVDVLARVLDERLWDQPAFMQRRKVT
jgi:kynureninase